MLLSPLRSVNRSGIIPNPNHRNQSKREPPESAPLRCLQKERYIGSHFSFARYHRMNPASGDLHLRAGKLFSAQCSVSPLRPAPRRDEACYKKLFFLRLPAGCG
jgi:hypothetical protein